MRELTFPAGEILVGRDPHCQVHVDSPLFSRRHARIEVAAGGATVEDLGSKNGTQLNGSALDAVVELREGDEVRAGSAVLAGFTGWRARGSRKP